MLRCVRCSGNCVNKTGAKNLARRHGAEPRLRFLHRAASHCGNTPRSRRDRLREVGGSKLRWAAALQSLTRSAARRSQPPVVALAGEKKKDGVVPWTLDRTGKALRRSHVAAAVTLKASSTTRATVRPRPEVVDTAEATQAAAARRAGQAARRAERDAQRSSEGSSLSPQLRRCLVIAPPLRAQRSSAAARHAPANTVIAEHLTLTLARALTMALALTPDH